MLFIESSDIKLEPFLCFSQYDQCNWLKIVDNQFGIEGVHPTPNSLIEPLTDSNLKINPQSQCKQVSLI